MFTSRVLIASVLAMPTLLTPTPAHAVDAADMRVDWKTQEVTLLAGGKHEEVAFTVTNQGPGIVAPTAIFAVPFASQGATATSANGQCATSGTNMVCALEPLQPGTGKDITIEITPPPAGTVADVASATGQLTVTATPVDSVPDSDPTNNKAELIATLEAPPTPVSEVSGSVVDSAGNPVPEAQVTITDEAETEVVVPTDSAGLFVYSATPTDPLPLHIGQLRFTARKAGYPDKATAKAKAGPMPLAGVALVLDVATASPAPSHVTPSAKNISARKNDEPLFEPWHVIAIGTALVLIAMIVLAIVLAVRSRAERRREQGAVPQ